MYCVFSIGRSLENNEQILKEKSMNKKSHSEILKELMEASEPESVAKNPVENERMNQLWSSMEKEHGHPLDVQRTP